MFHHRISNMKLKLYEEICNSCIECNGKNAVQKLLHLYPGVPEGTMKAVYDLFIQRYVKNNYHSRIVSKIDKHYEKYCSRVEAGNPPGVLKKMAHEIPFPPSMLARSILEHSLQFYPQDDQNPKKVVGKLLKDTSKIPDKILAHEVNLCLLDDEFYGPQADTIKQCIGNEYEVLLREKLKNLDIQFMDESDLRKSGFDKTPDTLLEVPIAVNGNIVNWIESKALFGDVKNHKTYMKDQLWSYWNRWGPGMVIYWFGFVDELHHSTEKGIQISDCFPEQSAITYMNPGS